LQNACFRQAAEQKMLTDRESQMGTNLFYIPGHKVTLSENAVPTAVVRPQKGGKTARREKQRRWPAFILSLLSLGSHELRFGDKYIHTSSAQTHNLTLAICTGRHGMGEI